MTPQRWTRIEEIFEQCLELAPSGHRAFLLEACQGDSDLRAEVESLLDAHRRARDFRPGAGMIRPVVEALETEYYLGRAFGNYKLQALVGRGGIGSVYRAIESSTNREVAVKILAPETISSPGDRQLLYDRCRKMMAIRHPNIAAIHALEQIDDAECIVLEFIDGVTLEHAVSIPQALSIAWRLVGALRTIHRSGAAHGDVRRANVMIGPAGQVKLVDFSVGEASSASDWKQYRALLRWMFAPRLRSAAIAAGMLALVSIMLGAWRFSLVAPPLSVSQLTYDSGLTTEPSLSRDGQLLAFASDRAGTGGLDIWVQPFPFGEARRLTQDSADDREPAFSPDGRWIVFRSERDGGNVYRMPVTGGNEQLFAPHGRRPRYSPDGQWLAYFTGEESDRSPNRIFVMPAGGGQPIPVAPVLASAHSPVWSPDSRELLLGGKLPGQERPALWLASLDGTPPRLLKVPPLRLNRFDLAAFRLVADAWTPGNRLLFTFHKGATTILGEAQISAGSLQGSVRALAEDGRLNVRATAAPDGRIVYASVRQDLNLWMQPLTQGPLTPLTVVEGAMMLYPSLRPDGKVLVMSRKSPSGVYVSSKNLETGVESLLADGLGHGSWAKLISEGARVAYFKEVDRSGAVFTRPIASGPSEFLTSVPEAPWDISPDGRHVLYPSVTGPVTLMTASREGASVFLAGDLSDARFSPDAKWVSFTARGRIFVAPFPAGGAWIQASDTPGSYAEWSTDGRSLYFLSNTDGFPCLWVQPLDPLHKTASGPARAIRHFHSYALTPNGAPRRHQRLAVSNTGVALSVSRQSGNLFIAQ